MILVGRDVVCGDCGHLVHLHEDGPCRESVLHGGGLSWPCPCVGFVSLGAAA